LEFAIPFGREFDELVTDTLREVKRMKMEKYSNLVNFKEIV
jgi:hypothetical protein